MPKTEKQIVGRIGEDIAAEHLKKNGYKIVKQNVHLGKNEIDIIAEDRENIIFVEVKTRSSHTSEPSGYGAASRAVTREKRSNTVTAARDYLCSNHTDKQPRIDVIEVYLSESTGELKTPTLIRINHIRNAFDARGRRLH